MARPTRKPGTKLTKTFSLRLSEQDFQLWMEKVAHSGLTTSEFFRRAVLENKSVVHQAPRLSKDSARLIFLFSKASNNLNQIAHRTNLAFQKGELHHEELMDILVALNALEFLFKEELAYVD